MTNLSVGLSVLGVIAGLLVAAATVVAFFRTQYAKATIETLRDSNDALKARVDELEAQNARQATKLVHLEQEAETAQELPVLAVAAGRLPENLHGLLTASALVQRLAEQLGNAGIRGEQPVRALQDRRRVGGAATPEQELPLQHQQVAVAGADLERLVDRSLGALPLAGVHLGPGQLARSFASSSRRFEKSSSA